MSNTANEFLAGLSEVVSDPSGTSLRFPMAVSQMDPALYTQVHTAIAPCTEQEFYDAYCAAHVAHFGTPFSVMTGTE